LTGDFFIWFELERWLLLYKRILDRKDLQVPKDLLGSNIYLRGIVGNL